MSSSTIRRRRAPTTRQHMNRDAADTRTEDKPDGPSGYEIWNVGGHLTETLRYRALPSTSLIKHVAVFFPGNPGIIGYYQPYLQALYAEFDGTLEVVGCSYPGHSLYIEHKDTKALSLDMQISHKIAFFNTVTQNYPAMTTHYILIGHSLGAYMCLKVLGSQPEATIVRVVALFPTLHSIANTPQGQRARVYTLPPIRWTAQSILSCMTALLTPKLFSAIVGAITGMQGQILQVTARMLRSPTNVSNAMYLGACEMDQIRDLVHREALIQHADKFILYYGAEDGWSPVSHYEEMRKVLSCAQVMLCRRGIPHAFVIEHSDLLAKMTREWLNNVL
ncbi:hypothetical protein BASA50_008417 [Batrachochytrium salamandrivorans]|uniref:Lipid droplet-associated hydrolase n=1 Tax=Batrachochytrium salamandrivorans TaxID=1357716 RepID=A0ABQ8F475_9FUNG|nr:hypothetical protein BASA62_003644 [Batrachochytrium salamandrivorans]KAH6575995.1 hypothetical protein BASA60_004720 [Batrachochytrium salamandrivorans]KAH6578725.1 hypothetical protein BASA61_000430 [Batrachochytrium salamandrivorans]KAH6591903.1 hypothetical protein BASA50_008417 [Batrachochytrium salamandrivorans]KAH9264671.1 hypothetical protein BASA83_011845 [Batrachochytrium salamandrivorans]